MLSPKSVIFRSVYIRLSVLDGNNLVFTSLEWIKKFPSLIYLKDDSNVHHYWRGFHINLPPVYHFYNLLSCCIRECMEHANRATLFSCEFPHCGFLLQEDAFWGASRPTTPSCTLCFLELQSNLPMECDFPQRSSYSSLLAFVLLRAQWECEIASLRTYHSLIGRLLSWTELFKVLWESGILDICKHEQKFYCGPSFF